MDTLLAKHIGQSVLVTGFGLSDPAELRAIVEHAGFHVRSLEFISRDSHFPDPASAARNFILSASAGIASFRQLDVDERDRLLEVISADMSEIVRKHTRANEFIVPWHAHIVIAQKE